jgi:hypothetical protein
MASWEATSATRFASAARGQASLGRHFWGAAALAGGVPPARLDRGAGIAANVPGRPRYKPARPVRRRPPRGGGRAPLGLESRRSIVERGRLDLERSQVHVCLPAMVDLVVDRVEEV